MAESATCLGSKGEIWVKVKGLKGLKGVGVHFGKSEWTVIGVFKIPT